MSANRPDDLADLFALPPAVPAQPVSYRQGVIVAFDKFTLANTVNVGGTNLTDLPILGVGETTMLGPGDVVGILVVGSTMAILGQLVIPNTPAAFEAISLPSSNVYTATVDVPETTTSTTWTDLPSFGPVVRDVRIGPSGRCLVFVTSTITLLVTDGGGEVSYAIEGATTVNPGDSPRTLAWYGPAGSGPTMTCLVEQEGLNTGLHTFTAKYIAADLGVGGSVRFNTRNLTVMAL